MRGRAAGRFAGAVAFVALVAGACDDGRAARAEQAAEWLRAYTQTHPPNRIWRATGISAADADKVVMDVLVLSPKQAAAIKAQNRIVQVRILQLACPPADAEVWKILDTDQPLWINLTSSEETIIGGTCKHRRP